MAAMTAELPNITCEKDIAEYLKGVKFKKKGEIGPGKSFCEFDTTGELAKKLFNDKVFIHDFDAAKAEIKKAVNAQCVKAATAGKSGWIQCEGKCYKILKKYAVKELKSTAFILRLLAKSMIDITKTEEDIENGDDGKEVTVIYDGKSDFSEITGKWMKKDKKHGDITHFTIDIAEKTPRLVMALGPSSAGKTFSGKTVMKMIKQAKSDFPTKFLSIDGGIYREESIVYQTILESMCESVTGFADLVSPNKWEELKHGTIFSAGTAKKEIAAWLKSKDIKLSLYIPETLGAPDTVASRPFAKIQKYIKITKDSNWIGLLIWQHLNDAEISKKKKNKIGKWSVMCDFPEQQKCKGTVPLGRKREKGEGKIYDSGAWLNSMKNGEKMLKEARGLIVDFHNSGQQEHKSTIREYPLKDGSYVFNKELVERNNMVYHKSEELPEESESGPETEAPLMDDPQILLVKRGPVVEEMFLKREKRERTSSYGGKRTRKRKRKRKRTKRKKRRKRKKGTKRRKKRTRRR